MRVSMFVDFSTGITRDAERVLTLKNPAQREGLGDELNLYLGPTPAQTAVIADRLIEALQLIRAEAIKASLGLPPLPFVTPRIDQFVAPELCPVCGRPLDVHEDGVHPSSDYDSPAGAGESVEASRG